MNVNPYPDDDLTDEQQDALVRPDCSACDGVGVSIGSWPSGGKDCKRCGGTGYEPQVSGSNPKEG